MFESLFKSSQPWHERILANAPSKEEIQRFVANPTVSDRGSWFGDATQAVQSKLPSSITTIAFVCAIGLFHSYFQPGNIKKMGKAYFALSQICVAVISFLSIMDQPHLQQIVATCLMVMMHIDSIQDFVDLARKIINPNSQTDKKSHAVDDDTKTKQFMKKQEQASTLYHSHEDSKDDAHHRHKPSQQHVLHQKTQSAAQSQSKDDNNVGRERFAKLLLFWTKIAVYSFISATPVMVANFTHISRSKKSLFNIFSWFSKSEYSLFNPFSLSLINWVGIGISIASILILKDSTRISKAIHQTLASYFSWWSPNLAYASFSFGLFLTCFAFNRPISAVFSLLAPIGSILFAVVKMLFSYQEHQREADVPNLLKKVHDQPLTQKLMRVSKNILPFVY
jgi:hypothetical protein